MEIDTKNLIELKIGDTISFVLENGVEVKIPNDVYQIIKSMKNFIIFENGKEYINTKKAQEMFRRVIDKKRNTRIVDVDSSVIVNTSNKSKFVKAEQKHVQEFITFMQTLTTMLNEHYGETTNSSSSMFDIKTRLFVQKLLNQKLIKIPSCNVDLLFKNMQVLSNGSAESDEETVIFNADMKFNFEWLKYYSALKVDSVGIKFVADYFEKSDFPVIVKVHQKNHSSSLVYTVADYLLATRSTPFLVVRYDEIECPSMQTETTGKEKQSAVEKKLKGLKNSNMMIMENMESITFKSYLSELPKRCETESIDSLYEEFEQSLLCVDYTIAALLEMGVTHNDLHALNVVITKVKTPFPILLQHSHKQGYFIEKLKVFVRVLDFDLSTLKFSHTSKKGDSANKDPIMTNLLFSLFAEHLAPVTKETMMELHESEFQKFIDAINDSEDEIDWKSVFKSNLDPCELICLILSVDVDFTSKSESENYFSFVWEFVETQLSSSQVKSKSNQNRFLILFFNFIQMFSFRSNTENRFKKLVEENVKKTIVFWKDVLSITQDKSVLELFRNFSTYKKFAIHNWNHHSQLPYKELNPAIAEEMEQKLKKILKSKEISAKLEPWLTKELQTLYEQDSLFDFFVLLRNVFKSSAIENVEVFRMLFSQLSASCITLISNFGKDPTLRSLLEEYAFAIIQNLLRSITDKNRQSLFGLISKLDIFSTFDAKNIQARLSEINWLDTIEANYQPIITETVPNMSENGFKSIIAPGRLNAGVVDAYSPFTDMFRFLYVIHSQIRSETNPAFAPLKKKMCHLIYKFFYDKSNLMDKFRMAFPGIICEIGPLNDKYTEIIEFLSILDKIHHSLQQPTIDKIEFDEARLELQNFEFSKITIVDGFELSVQNYLEDTKETARALANNFEKRKALNTHLYNQIFKNIVQLRIRCIGQKEFDSSSEMKTPLQVLNEGKIFEEYLVDISSKSSLQNAYQLPHINKSSL